LHSRHMQASLGDHGDHDDAVFLESTILTDTLVPVSGQLVAASWMPRTHYRTVHRSTPIEKAWLQLLPVWSLAPAGLSVCYTAMQHD
jgi:hypothetical protein